MGNAHFLAGRTEVDAAFPVEPVGAGFEAPTTPAMAFIKLADQGEQAVGRGIDMRGEFGDFVFECGQVAGRRWGNCSGELGHGGILGVLAKNCINIQYYG